MESDEEYTYEDQDEEEYTYSDGEKETDVPQVGGGGVMMIFFG